MKRAHRRVHFAIWALLGPILLWLVFLAVMERPPAPQNDALPDMLIEEAG
jgi:hypothetical protein